MFAQQLLCDPLMIKKGLISLTHLDELLKHVSVSFYETLIKIMSERPTREPEEWEVIETLEKEMFPEFAGLCCNSFTSNGSTYNCFAPSHFFRQGLLTNQDVERLKEKERNILSIGSGPAHLERMLVKLGIPIENISLSDVTETNLPPGFRTHIFDMHSEIWPQLEEGPFDLIIIPEAFSVSLPSLPFDQYMRNSSIIARMLSDVIHKAVQNLKPNGELRIIDPGFYEHVMGYLERSFSHPSATFTHKSSTILVANP